MITTNTVALITLLALVSNGCMRYGYVTRNLKDDHSTVVHNILTPWGTSKLIRSNPTTNQLVTITPDGTVTIQVK